MRLLVLYEEPAAYFLSCLEDFQQATSATIVMIRKKDSPNAPVNLSGYGITMVDYEQFSEDGIMEFCREFSPTAIYCGGWADKNYNRICALFRKSIPVVVGIDNQWRGTIRQWAGTLLAAWLIRRRFNRCFVAGDLQRTFARKLGFKPAQIESGLYCCEQDLFKDVRQLSHLRNGPLRFFYAGRYVPHKGIHDLWEAFLSLPEESGAELICIGTGPVPPLQHPRIKHLGFLQPPELAKAMAGGGVFILPSHYEPWGVVVHEFATAGFPMILSDAVGARTAFLEPGQNGYLYRNGDVNGLRDAMTSMLSASPEKIDSMGMKSRELSKRISHETWTASLLRLIR